jgi:endo-1,4-beta-xylanase
MKTKTEMTTFAVLCHLLIAMLFAPTLLSAQTAQSEHGRITDGFQAPFTAIPEAYFVKPANAGRLERIEYTPTVGLNKGNPKYALVYLPAGYDDSGATENKFLYLLHGGGDRPESWTTVDPSLGFLTVLDNMSLRKDAKPFVVVFTTYLSDHDRQNPGGERDALNNRVKDFWRELTTDLLPLVEKKYHGTAKSFDAQALKASRNDRCIGGFSMGGVATWAVYENAMDYFKYYMPLSGDSWAKSINSDKTIAKENVAILKSATERFGYTPDQYMIFAATGTKDIAYPNLSNQVDEMKNYPEVWKYGYDFPENNFYYLLRQDGIHDYHNQIQYVYNALKVIFKP